MPCVFHSVCALSFFSWSFVNHGLQKRSNQSRFILCMSLYSSFILSLVLISSLYISLILSKYLTNSLYISADVIREYLYRQLIINTLVLVLNFDTLLAVG